MYLFCVLMDVHTCALGVHVGVCTCMLNVNIGVQIWMSWVSIYTLNSWCARVYVTLCAGRPWWEVLYLCLCTLAILCS